MTCNDCAQEISRCRCSPFGGQVWRDLPEVMARCEKAGVLLRDGYLVRRGNPFVPTVREDSL